MKHFPEEHIADGRPGRKPIPTRHVLEAVLWILNTGAQWHMLPQSYPNYKTVHRRFQTWCCNEILRRVLTDVANELRDKGALSRRSRTRFDTQIAQQTRRHRGSGQKQVALIGKFITQFR
jgi:transposase